MSDQFDPEQLRQLAQQASQEMDTEKLLALVKKINDLLDPKSGAKSTVIDSIEGEKTA
jgi:hypothetical protein